MTMGSIRKNHDADRQRRALDLLTKHWSGHDRWIISAAQSAVHINSHGFRSRNRDLLVNATRVKKWAKNGALPCTRGVGGRKGRPIAIPQSVLNAWLIGGARGYVKLGRGLSAKLRTPCRPRLALRPDRAGRPHERAAVEGDAVTPAARQLWQIGRP